MPMVRQNSTDHFLRNPAAFLASLPVTPWHRWLLVAVVVVALGGFFALRPVPPRVLFGLALLGALILAVRQVICWRADIRRKAFVAAGVLIFIIAAIGVRTYLRYQTADVMQIPVREYSNEEYPEDPANRSVHHGKYLGRQLILVKKDDTHFDFIFEPIHPHVAKIAIRNVDVSLMTPSLPNWTKDDDGLLRIALTDRQWNRQQVRFDPHSAQIEVTGGEGFEKENLFSLELAKNCLNAGLWELLLFVKEGSDKALYYQGWFTFPLGHYRDIFEYNTGLPYQDHWYYLEHWFDPEDMSVPMAKLRRVISEREVPATFDQSEKVIAIGEQLRKRRTTLTENIVYWRDFFSGGKVRYASFIPPGRYSVNHPWDNQYWRMDRFEKAILREIVTPASEKHLHELELVFSSSKEEGICRFFVSGFDLSKLPQLQVQDYPKGLYMPMGIGVPPFYQSYDELQKNLPYESPYVSVLLDGNEKWLNHHSFSIDGPVMHRDATDPDLLHVYLMSYERHSLVGHFVVWTPGAVISKPVRTPPLPRA